MNVSVKFVLHSLVTQISLEFTFMMLSFRLNFFKLIACTHIHIHYGKESMIMQELCRTLNEHSPSPCLFNGGRYVPLTLSIAWKKCFSRTNLGSYRWINRGVCLRRYTFSVFLGKSIVFQMLGKNREIETISLFLRRHQCYVDRYLIFISLYKHTAKKACRKVPSLEDSFSRTVQAAFFCETGGGRAAQCLW